MAKYNSPEGAALSLEEPLHDAGNPGGVLVVSIHQDGKTSYCNTWLKVHGEWARQIPERVWDGPPSARLMMGELVRYSNRCASDIQNDDRLVLAIAGLSNQIGEEAKKI